MSFFGDSYNPNVGKKTLRVIIVINQQLFELLLLKLVKEKQLEQWANKIALLKLKDQLL